MNTFNKKSLYAAIAGVSALGVTGTAEAVHVNPDGLGQVLIYPYYTVRTRAGTVFTNPQFNSLLSVVNSTASAKAVKVRFLEGLDSKEVLDFNLFLSAFDVWTTGVVPTADGAGIVTFDKSCTVPTVSSDASNPSPFVNFVYADTDPDNGDSSLDRTREGYVEIIEMGDIAAGTATEAGITHDKTTGVPTCADLPLQITDANAANVVVGKGGLFGTMTIINVNASAETGYDAVALDAFYTLPPPAPSLFAPAGSTDPTLAFQADTSAPVGTAIVGHQAETFNNGKIVISNWENGEDAVSAALMHDAVMNEYVLDAGTASLTDWVVTYPTKRFYLARTNPAPFENFFDMDAGGACDTVSIAFWNREELVQGGPPPGFSPPPKPGVGAALCFEANVVTFNNSDLFASTTSATENIDTKTFQNGWARLGLVGGKAPPTHVLVSPAGQSFNGLPVVGFATMTYFNGNIPATGGGTLQSAYGASFKHKTTTTCVVGSGATATACPSTPP